jgi:hypothetical protein
MSLQHPDNFFEIAGNQIRYRLKGLVYTVKSLSIGPRVVRLEAQNRVYSSAIIAVGGAVAEGRP